MYSYTDLYITKLQIPVTVNSKSILTPQKQK